MLGFTLHRLGGCRAGASDHCEQQSERRHRGSRLSRLTFFHAVSLGLTTVASAEVFADAVRHAIRHLGGSRGRYRERLGLSTRFSLAMAHRRTENRAPMSGSERRFRHRFWLRTSDDRVHLEERSLGMKRLLLVAASCAVLTVGGAFAGEVKGPPRTLNNTNETGALDHANSACAASGLNDFDWPTRWAKPRRRFRPRRTPGSTTACRRVPPENSACAREAPGSGRARVVERFVVGPAYVVAHPPTDTSVLPLDLPA